MPRNYIIFVLMCMMLLLPGECFVRAESKSAKPKISLSSGEDSSVRVTIGNTTGADGFRIYIKSDSDSKFRKLATIKKTGSGERVYVTESLDPGNYQFIMRIYDIICF